MKTIRRQRAIRRILHDALRSKVSSSMSQVLSHDLQLYVDFETVNHGPISIKELKGHLRTVCDWLYWIDTSRRGKPCVSHLAVEHAIRQTRNVGY
jgi:hypothetical protein